MDLTQETGRGVPKERHSSSDDYKVELNPDHTTHFTIDVKTCDSANSTGILESGGVDRFIEGTSGIIYLVNYGTLSAVPKTCSWRIIVPERQYVAARIEFVPELCLKFIQFMSYQTLLLGSKDSQTCESETMIYSLSNKISFAVYFDFQKQLTVSSNFTLFYLFFTTVTRDGNRLLPVTMMSPSTGYVTSNGFGGKAGYSALTNARYDMIVPPDHVVMIRLRYVDIYCGEEGGDRLSVYEVYKKKLNLVSNICGNELQPPQLHNTSLVICLVTKRRQENLPPMHLGFKMDFSFHADPDAPVMHDDGSLNCSGSNYKMFQQHVHCDLVPHCAGGEDEGRHCPFSSQLCEGQVALGTKCYTLFRNDTNLLWDEATQACKHRGGILAIMRSAEEREAVKSVFGYMGVLGQAYVGLRKVAHSIPSMYWKLWAWTDGVVAYNAEVRDFVSLLDDVCATLDHRFPSFLYNVFRSKRTCRLYVCEFDKLADVKKQKQLPKAPAIRNLGSKVSILWSKHAVTECPFGHVTFSFLSCQPSANCTAGRFQSHCTTRYLHTTPEVADQDRLRREAELTTGRTRQEETTGQSTASGSWPAAEQSGLIQRLVAVTVSLFACDVGTTTLPYTLVCDYVTHCPRGSDETFCNHGDECPDMTCANDRCLSPTQICDDFYDCPDQSDENGCPLPWPDYSFNQILRRLPPPSIIDFDGHGNFAQRPMLQSESCPETHFSCLGVESHCLPVYVRCNGVYDCPGREDEETCDSYACPGFYRCWESRICVHADHMCDGWTQCPQHDDELYCGLTCPPGCLCQGLAIVCFVKFPAQEYPQTRYIDASFSKMKPSDFFLNVYLVWLSVASCGIDRLSGLTWSNVIYLDLSRNNIVHLIMDVFLTLPNLRTLILANNPLASFAKGSECSAPTVLQTLDLSETQLRQFDSNELLCYPYITHLNVSECPLDKITDNGFRFIPYLISVDLRGSPVSRFPWDIFKMTDYLQFIRTENYRICCKVALPLYFNDNFCYAPRDEISSCEDLLKSNMFRGSIWIFAAFAIVGNLFCFLFKVLSKNTHRSGFHVFVANLTVADFLMGVYLVTVGVADLVYRGQYVLHDTTWKKSTACTIAGFLSLLSSEMSAFLICLITLDRFVVLTFPFSEIRFKGLSATVTCAFVWTVCVVLASVPLFPVTSFWEFYGQTGICVPLPITRKRFPGHNFAFGIMIVLNFLLCALIAVGQASIYWSVRVNSMTTDSSRKTQDLIIARRLITVAVSDFLCWFPIGLLGLLSSNDVPVASEVSVAMAIFVLPLNSALNPFLYTFNVVMEKRRKSREAQLIKFLEARILSQQRGKENDCRSQVLKQA